MYSIDDTCFDLQHVSSAWLSQKTCKCFWLNCSLDFVFARHAAQCERIKRQAQYGNKPEVMMLFISVAWMGIGWLQASHFPSLGLPRQFSIEVGSRLTCIYRVTLGKLHNLSKPQFPSL
jgi:hypothetical protein